MNDIDIARKIKGCPISQIAEKAGIPKEALETYGSKKAKLPLSLLQKEKIASSQLILVTAMTPTPPGEGKTTVSIGLCDGLNRIGKKAMVALREPSLGPIFGLKGGATGGGHSQVIPMEDINLHFTGDFSAIEKANNLLSALIDNELQSQERSLNLDPRTILWKRVMDMNDRSLRNIVIGLGGKSGGTPRETGFNITAASEIMAILCLSHSLEDLRTKIGNIYIGDTFDRKPVFVKELNAQGAMTVLLKDAILPNLVQTLEGNPAILHGGPFANIAQGTNSILATQMCMSFADYVVTEAGFGADLGAEKFLNIKCRQAGLSPKAVVLVATVRALKYHGGMPLQELHKENTKALEQGMPNLQKHIENLQAFGIPLVVCINRFTEDTPQEIEWLQNWCMQHNLACAVAEGWAKGGEGCVELAEKVCIATASCQSTFAPTYKLEDSIQQKIEKVCLRIYGAQSVSFSHKSQIQIKRFEALGLQRLPICIAKTQKSFSEDEKCLGRPEGFTIHIREFELATGAGFIIPIVGDLLRMPGLPKQPASLGMNIDENGEILGLA